MNAEVGLLVGLGKHAESKREKSKKKKVFFPKARLQIKLNPTVQNKMQ